jgi:multiple sugar transport system permease protein
VWIIVLALFLAFFFLPIVWLVLAPTRTSAQLNHGSALGFGSFAHIGHAFHQVASYEGGAFFIWMKNSLIYSIGALVLTVGSAIPAGYALARTEFIGRRLLLSITLVVMIIPSTALVLPLFLEMNAVHLVDSAWSVILPMGFFPFGAYLAYIYFSTALPAEVLDSGRVDGCSELRLFRHVALPLARPIVALVSFFGFVASWNNFFLPYVMLPSSSKYPLQVGLQDLLASTPAFNPTIGGGQSAFYLPELAFSVLLAAFPVLLIYLFAQRHLVSGLLAGSMKE